MTVEVATYVNQLTPTLPPRSDLEVEGADHLRLLKSVLQSTFPNAGKIFNLIVTNKTIGNYTVVFPTDMNSVQVIDATAAARTVTLPNPTGIHADGWKLWVVKLDSTINTVTAAGGGNLINGLANYVLKFPNQIVELVWSVAAGAWYAADSFFGFPPAAGSFAAPYTLLASDFARFIEMDATAASRTVTLPTGANALLNGFTATIMKIDATVNPVVLSPQSGNINGLASISLYGANDAAQLFWDGSTWRAILFLQDAAPVGTVGNSLLTTVFSPKWLALQGANFDRTVYAPLFAAWGTNFGTGNGVTTAGLPDTRGYFPRYQNAGSGNDPDAAARTSRGDGTTGDTPGTKQVDGFKSHNHPFNPSSQIVVVQGGGLGSGGGVISGGSATIGITGGNETRPLNIYMCAYVKALP